VTGRSTKPRPSFNVQMTHSQKTDGPKLRFGIEAWFHTGTEEHGPRAVLQPIYSHEVATEKMQAMFTAVLKIIGTAVVETALAKARNGG
jgi:hypothetical protein